MTNESDVIPLVFNWFLQKKSRSRLLSILISIYGITCTAAITLDKVLPNLKDALSTAIVYAIIGLAILISVLFILRSFWR